MSRQLDVTVGGLLDQMAASFPSNEALVYPDRGVRYSYSEFNEVCRKVAKGLLRLGIKKGDNISIWAYNVPEWVVLQFATAKIVAVLVTVNTSYKSAELEYILRQSDSTTLFMVKSFKDTDYVRILEEVVPGLALCEPGRTANAGLPHLKNVVFIGDDTPAGMFNFAQVVELGREVPDSELAAVEATLGAHDVINMQYTSGTTGFPKGVMLTHYNVVNIGFNIGECMKLTEKDRLCIPVPFFHCFGCVLGVLAILTHGATTVMVESFDPVIVLAAVQKTKATALYGVPTMFIAELASPMFDLFDLSSLRTGIMAGSPCPVETMKQVIDRMHA
ncbi:MAG TPA: AMP-binding protein, partial [Geomonas sp.]